MIGKILEKIPYIRYAYWYRKNSSNRPGSYYSSVTDVDYVKANEHLIWPDDPNDQWLNGININKEEQVKFLKSLKDLYDKLDLAQFDKPKGQVSGRYSFHNTWYTYADATLLYLMIMNFRPKRIIEVGSGHSSAMMLDINNTEFNNQLSLTFIDPNPQDRLLGLIRETDKKSAHIIPQMVQHVDMASFTALEENDILFIDNSHVSKIGSDVNHMFFEIFPRLKKGVIIHIHDIFNGFMYPKNWVYEIRNNWNEIFLCRAFLMYNTQFEILLFPDYLINKEPELFNKDFPYLAKSRNQTIWLRKL
ncbi:MAG: hypothetical protein K0Q79_2498 [Flavipsychrobacter sp.]|jgi:hypothetical protein|nr:hypothetical protein [Flavipsychrobacter sp.]